MTMNIDEIDFDLITKQIETLRSQSEGSESRIKEIKTRLADLSKEINVLTRERTELERNQNAVRSTILDLEKQSIKAARLKQVKEEQARIEKEFREKASELDELTKNKVWRTGTDDGYTAFEYQIEGGKRLAVARRGILGDKRGLGKTITGIVWADMVQARKILLVAPNDVVDQFEGEIRTWSPERSIFSLRGLSPSQRALVFNLMKTVPEFIATINYEAWRRDKTIIDSIVEQGFDTVILDEAHRIKSSDKMTARGIFQAVYRPNYCETCDIVTNYCGPWEGKDRYPFYSPKDRNGESVLCPVCKNYIGNTVQNVLSMTGTPILNKPQELYSLLFLVDPVAFPSEGKFIDDYTYSVAPNKFRFMPGGLERLTKTMSGFFLQRNRDDVGIEIPPPSITIHRLNKDLVNYKRQYEAEKEINQKAALILEDGTKRDIFFVLEMMLRERQCMTWPSGITIRDPETKEIVCKVDIPESQKLDAAMELLQELCEEEERVIIFSQFKAPLYEMHDRITRAGYSAALATGDQSDYHKQQVRHDFDLKTAPENPRFQVCFATYKAFGTGINLNAARHMILLDDEWNPGNEDQAIGRIDRINSVDQANVHIFRVNKSIDDFMEKLLESKRQIVDGFNESIGADELLAYFKD